MNPFRILTLADIHGNLKATKKLITYLRDNSIEIDLIAIAGDLPATTSLLVMAQYMLRHPFQALSKFLYTKWVYKNGGRKFFIKKPMTISYGDIPTNKRNHYNSKTDKNFWPITNIVNFTIEAQGKRTNEYKNV